MSTPTSPTPKTAEVPARQPRPRDRRRTITLAVGTLVAATGLVSAAGYEAYHASTPSPAVTHHEKADGTTVIVPAASENPIPLHGRIDTVDYQQEYQGVTYKKQALVYVPATYIQGTAANIAYLTHGWMSSAEEMADEVSPAIDDLERSGALFPTIVVFATYYPDRSFVNDDFETDYQLNRFFATSEINTLIDTIESRYSTYADGDTTDESLKASRTHRAFGGFSMGGITAWDVFALNPDYFYGYMPMAGESWIGRDHDAPLPQIAEEVTLGARSRDMGPQDFRIIASVGSDDPALDDMNPQLGEFYRRYPTLMTPQSLQVWIDEGGTHSLTSVSRQLSHALPLLFPNQ
ncbi:esterase family protein [uncultured Actinomyces sp.]|uniref:alpha/beta hydrolase n=1 Tax=uncultured Actinomyces sp. TaxID=249061 RepID=UPI00263212BD|nr:alpha/beta hydrolase-fold protein [uncultured Actinomyces sp.]